MTEPGPLADRPMILDGGMGQELVRRAPGPATPLWSTQVLLDDPSLVADVHDDYFAAGAEVASTATYGLLPGSPGTGWARW